MSDGSGAVSATLLEHVAAAAAGVRSSRSLDVEVAEHRAGGQRTVLEYRFPDGLSIFAKRYPRQRSATQTIEILNALWEGGFGPGSPVGVPEPLGCFPQWGVILTRRVRGHSLHDVLDLPGELQAGLAASGTWLGMLHTSSLDVGPIEARTDAAYRLARLAVRAAAHHPELEGLFVELIRRLGKRAKELPDRVPRVPTHGRYHLRHVFVAPDRVTAIDLDRVALADPAKDVAEFLHNLFLPVAKRSGGRPAEGWASEFLRAYEAVAGTLPAGLAYWWSYSVVWRMLGVVVNERPRWEPHLERYRAEFEAVPEFVEALRSVGST